MTLSEEKTKETEEKLKQLEGLKDSDTINWLKGAFWTHTSQIEYLLRKLEELRELYLSKVKGQLTVREGQLLKVCRFCREKEKAPFTYNYGNEYAHTYCLEKDELNKGSCI